MPTGPAAPRCLRADSINYICARPSLFTDGGGRPGKGPGKNGRVSCASSPNPSLSPAGTLEARGSFATRKRRYGRSEPNKGSHARTLWCTRRPQPAAAPPSPKPSGALRGAAPGSQRNRSLRVRWSRPLRTHPESATELYTKVPKLVFPSRLAACPVQAPRGNGSELLRAAEEKPAVSLRARYLETARGVCVCVGVGVRVCVCSLES